MIGLHLLRTTFLAGCHPPCVQFCIIGSSADAPSAPFETSLRWPEALIRTQQLSKGFEAGGFIFNCAAYVLCPHAVPNNLQFAIASF
jgi:hypothetical protein